MEERVEGSAKGASKEVVEVMETPKSSKNSQIAASISKFEDSPVFKFLNSLSPIQQVKSSHITQTINPLNFASIPSVFTSPHVRLRTGSRFLQRNKFSDPSEPEFSSDDGNKVDRNGLDRVDTKQLDEQKESGDGEAAADSSYDCSNFIVDFGKDYDCTSPNSNLRPGCGLEYKGMADYNCSSSALVSFIPQASQRGEVNMDMATQMEQNREASSCDWEHMIFESPDDRDSYYKSGTSFYTGNKSDMQSLPLICAVDSSEQVVVGNEAEYSSAQPGEDNEIDNGDGSSSSNPGEMVDYEHLGFGRGIRRRCLVYEMGGGRGKYLEENSGSWLHSDGNTPSSDQNLVSIQMGNDSSHSLSPYGLHLNHLAMTPKDYKIINPDSSASARSVIGPSSVINLHPSTTSLLDNILPTEDACLPSGYFANEEINQSSPKKKRRKSEQAGDGQSCKRCNCKKSKCLKLYCECFAAGVYCMEPCSCKDCFNKPIHEDTVIATRKQIESRNPLAFAPKVIRGSDSPSEIGQDESSKTPASARHKRGCNCKKSGCLKKYCECYQSGVGCSVNCRCEGCKNAFGRKDGMEAEAEEDETEAAEKHVPGKRAMECDSEVNTDSAPLRGGGRSSTEPSLISKKKLLPPPPPKFETIREDEIFIPEFLQGGVKSSSPNGKRVSPPHHADGLRSSRKLILESIPSFPSLAPNQ